MAHSDTSRPSLFGAFFSGFGSGAINGALMLGIFALVGPLFGVGVTLLSACATILTTGIFSGMMGVKRTLSEAHAPEHASESRTQERTTPVLVPMVGHGVSAQMDMADEAESAPTRRWSDRFSEGKQDRVQQILAQGASADRDRAAEILAARDAAADAAPVRS